MAQLTVELTKPGQDTLRLTLNSAVAPLSTGDWRALPGSPWMFDQGILDDQGGDLLGKGPVAVDEVFFRLIGCGFDGGPTTGPAWLGGDPVFTLPRLGWTWHIVDPG